VTPAAEPVAHAPAVQPRREPAPDTRHTAEPVMRPAPEPKAVATPKPVVETPKPATRHEETAATAAAPSTVVVPVTVTLPANGTPGELVIRIVLKHQE